jgi:tRNA-modifying protein YgfZ
MMAGELHDLQQRAGAKFESSAGVGEALVAVGFGNDQQALTAAETGVALCDRSHWGRIQVTGRDRVSFLHNQSTNDLKTRQPGQGCETVFITSTARTLDLATAYVTEDEVLLLVSPNRRQQLLTWLDRYIFFNDQVVLTDLTPVTTCFSLLGPQSQTLLEQLGIQMPETASVHDHQEFSLSDGKVRVALGTGLEIAGYTLILDADSAPAIWQQLTAAGAVPMGEAVWEQLRILQGRPKPDQELTEDYNPLEARLLQTVSFNKGCYIGQETIARLNTYQGVKQQLWGIELAAFVPAGAVIHAEGEETGKIGVLTSCTVTSTGTFGLGYVKTKAGGAGLTVKVGETTGILVDVPYLKI